MGWLIIGFSLLFVLDFIPIIVQKKTKTIIIYLLFFVSAFIMAIIQIKDIQRIHYLYFVEKILESFGIGY